MAESKKITVIGTGYVGLVTAVGFAEKGHKVIGVDKDENKIKKLQNGISPIYEPGLEPLLKKNLNANLEFTTDIDYAIRASDLLFVCVGTPQKDDGSADLSQVEEVARKIAQNLNSYKLIVEKSTVPVKTAQWIKRTINLYCKNKSVDFDVASNPEFLREGSAVHDFFNPDRIVIGVDSEKARNILTELYESFNSKILITDINTAEIIKHASNSFLAMKISYINMIADLCEKTGADITEVAEGIGLDHRIGREFLNAGLGYGGSCFPKDVRAFIKIAENYNLDFGLLREVDKINNSRIDHFVRLISQALWIIKDKTIAIWGLSFKPNTDDIREAPSIKVIKRLLKEGAHLRLYDPKAMENMKMVIPENPPRIFYAQNAYEAAKDSHAVAIITEWDEFKNIDFEKLKSLLITPIIIDGRNIFEPQTVKNLGFEYYSIGRPYRNL